MGYLFSSFYFGQFAGAYLWGTAADKYGRRPVMMLGPHSGPTHLPLPLPGVDIRNELKGVIFISFWSQFGCFLFSVFRPDSVVLVNFGRKKLVMVEFGQEKWFWSILAGKTGF